MLLRLSQIVESDRRIDGGSIALQAYWIGDSQVRGPGGACAGDLPDCGLSVEGACMTENQNRFFALLEEFPRVASYWDKESCSLDIARLQEELAQMSSGEAAIARFFPTVWLGENEFGFDMIQHVPDCDKCGQALISAWVSNPFFP